MSNSPVILIKGASVRRATTARQRVQAEWEGYKPVDKTALVALTHPQLQALAKNFGVKANQSSEALAAEIYSTVSGSPEAVQSVSTTPAPDTDDTGSPVVD